MYVYSEDPSVSGGHQTHTQNGPGKYKNLAQLQDDHFKILTKLKHCSDLFTVDFLSKALIPPALLLLRIALGAIACINIFCWANHH